MKNLKFMQKIFHTQYGEVAMTMRSVTTDIEGNLIAVYECKVITSDGIVKTPSIVLELDQPMTQALVEKAAFSTTPEGKAANRRHSDKIRQFILSQRQRRVTGADDVLWSDAGEEI